MLSIKINHDAENAILRALAADALRPLADRAVDAGLHVLASEITGRAPVHTGALKNSVSVRQHDTARGVQGEVVVGTHHAAFVEFGTAHNAAQPFIRPAVDAARARIAAAMADTIRDAPRS